MSRSQTRTYDKDLDIDGATAAALADDGKPRVKYHVCGVCDLPVAQNFSDPDLCEAASYLTLRHTDTVYAPQWGPVCGAASVAGTVLSLLKAAGHAPEAFKDVVTVRLVQDIYASLGVPDVHTDTHAVGNLTVKKACMMLRVPGLPTAQLTVSDLAFLLAKDPRDKANAEWARLKQGMAQGARYLYHCRNHYCRVFGWRELYRAPKAGDEGAAAASPTVQDHQSSSFVQEESGGTTPAGGVDKENAGGEDGPVPAPPPPARRLSGAPPTGLRRVGSARTNAAAGGSVGKPVGLKARVGRATPSTSTSASLEHLAPPGMQPYLVSRQVLMAKKSQRPQHWVEWDAIAADTAGHKLHMLFEVKLVQRG